MEAHIYWYLGIILGAIAQLVIGAFLLHLLLYYGMNKILHSAEHYHLYAVASLTFLAISNGFKTWDVSNHYTSESFYFTDCTRGWSYIGWSLSLSLSQNKKDGKRGGGNQKKKKHLAACPLSNRQRTDVSFFV